MSFRDNPFLSPLYSNNLNKTLSQAALREFFFLKRKKSHLLLRNIPRKIILPFCKSPITRVVYPLQSPDPKPSSWGCLSTSRWSPTAWLFNETTVTRRPAVQQ
ncbi:hypothetical protein CDAR_597641 [Caerostris darwini]|uniref:Uncharacterized protein n=1 Tax=Caerostris darwini TaxID=1538125 RepID=A0AAV4X0A4_9ARAC|nr:hypothetical protein CDAR_597641 [Caerostris darwini]